MEGPYSGNGTASALRIVEEAPREPPKLGLRKQLSGEEWEELKPLIQTLYIEEGRTFAYIANILREGHNFKPTYDPPYLFQDQANRSTEKSSSMTGSGSGSSRRTPRRTRESRSFKISELLGRALRWKFRGENTGDKSWSVGRENLMVVTLCIPFLRLPKNLQVCVRCKRRESY
jgi:hypothetical protein